ncbi:hypothetical protein [Albidovulum aquaemixtae]|uniref:hypothetical protein n=1 Tax=Albidovulum aquaemixtae TaxID=1542388 RepID=UPI0011B281D5|nr:hypothetical protein [Defluviimonas aquaemixtae]
MADLSLQAFDEVINARRTLHGGNRGAPVKLADGSREGIALNNACVVMLSSALQSFVEEVFLDCSFKAFGRVLVEPELRNYRATWSRWGNPSPSNIVSLFRRLGVDDVFEGLSWQKQAAGTLKSTLDTINQVRNCIAHGSALTVNRQPYSLQLNNITRWRNTAEQFGKRFQAHAEAKIR